MTRDPYVWIDPWEAVEFFARHALTREDIEFAASYSPPIGWTSAPATRFDAKTQDERDVLCMATGGVVGGMIQPMTIQEAAQHMGSPGRAPDRSVPIWLLAIIMAIIMLGIAVGVPMIVGWLS